MRFTSQVLNWSALFFLAGFSNPAYPQVKKSDAAVALNSVLSQNASQARASGSPQSGVAVECLRLDGLESRDEVGDPVNIIVDLDIGPGNQLTGVGWNVGLETIGGSWLSEAAIYLSDTIGGDSDPNGIALNLGFEEQAPGDINFSSQGTVDFAAYDLPPVTAGPNGILQRQLAGDFVNNSAINHQDCPNNPVALNFWSASSDAFTFKKRGSRYMPTLTLASIRGEIIWQREFDFINEKLADFRAMVEVSSGFVVTGSYQKDFGVDSEVFIMMLDEIGEPIWIRELTGSKAGTIAADLLRHPEGGLLVAGAIDWDILISNQQKTLGVKSDAFIMRSGPSGESERLKDVPISSVEVIEKVMM